MIFSAKQLIRDAIQKNDFLRQLDKEQTIQMVECMYEMKCKAGDWVIKEGDAGDRLFGSARTCLTMRVHEPALTIC